MKLLNLVIFLTVSILTFSGCVESTPKPNDKPVIDSTLPVVKLTPNGVFTDMKAIGFEWHGITDPRVKGIYVFKQIVGKEASDYKYLTTIQSRFVTHFVDEDVKPQTQYNYYFKTFSDKSESKPSQAVSAKTLPVLDSVSWIYALKDMPRSAKIIWRPHTNHIVKAYILERKTLVDDEWDKLVTIDGRLNAEYIDSNLKDNFVYKYRIRVVTYNGLTSKPSKEVTVVTKALPAQVTNIVATKNIAKKIKITWDKTNIVDFLHYNIYRSTSIDGKYKLIASVKKEEYIDSVDKDGVDYFYRVSTVDGDELESKHDVKSIHGKSLARPITPTLVEVKMVGDNLEISWKSTDPRVKSYVVNKRVSRGWINRSHEEFIDIKDKTFVDHSIEPETTYYYTVSSVDRFSIKSEPSIEVKFTTSKTQGKKRVVKKDKPKQNLDTKNPALQNNSGNIVQPMEDIDKSGI